MSFLSQKFEGEWCARWPFNMSLTEAKNNSKNKGKIFPHWIHKQIQDKHMNSFQKENTQVRNEKKKK